MKANQLFQLSFLLFFSVACVGKRTPDKKDNDSPVDTITGPTTNATDSFAIGKIIDPVVCENDASQSYALYIPLKGNNEPMPVIYFFDPHGGGALPLNKYRSLADKYGFILAGSNNSKNGTDWTITENIISSLFTDTQKRLKIENDRIYACGFSGGAKVASYAALQHNEVRGVIVGGAGLPDGIPASNFNFSYTILSGEGDMNMTDLVSLNDALDKTATNHRMVFFNGKHEWSPETTMDIAFAGLQLDAMRAKIIPADEMFITNYDESAKKRFNDAYQKDQLIKAADECKLSINMLKDLTKETDWFQQKETMINNSSAFQQQVNSRNDLLKKEQDLKNSYEQQFSNGDMNYWTGTIKMLQSKAQVQNAEGAMYQRLIAYLSLAFYSISNQLINSDKNDQAQYFVTLYKLDDPTNSDAWYFSAILHARNNDAKATEDDLLKAVKNGFNDKAKMMQQPEFENLSSQIDLSQIEAGMNKTGR